MQLEPIRERTIVNYVQLEQIPEPVARYFRKVLRDGQPLIQRALLIQSGEFRTSATGKWKRFHATEKIATSKPEFTWNASMKMAPLLAMKVEDSYSHGEASMRGKVCGMQFLHAREDRRLAVSALQRYLAEAPWFPTALLPRQELRWSNVDKNHAFATLLDHGLEACMFFEFSKEDYIVGSFTPGRYQYIHGEYKLEPWGGRYSNYENRNGIRIPTESEVEWLSPENNFCYYRATIDEIEYEF